MASWSRGIVLAETGIGVGGIQVERQPGVQRELGTDAAAGPAGFRVARVADEHDLGVDIGSAPLGRTRNGVRDAGSTVTRSMAVTVPRCCETLYQRRVRVHVI